MTTAVSSNYNEMIEELRNRIFTLENDNSILNK